MIKKTGTNYFQYFCIGFLFSKPAMNKRRRAIQPK